MNQEMWSAYSMTEPQGGSDPNLFVTNAVRDGEEWVINGEKWFTSAGGASRPPVRDDHERHVRGAPKTPGVEFVPTDRPGHSHIRYTDVRVPLDHLLGPQDGAKVLAQRRLGGGRIHHAMRSIAQCKLAFDMMCERALSRRVARQDHRRAPDGAAGHRRLYAEINMLRLMVLWTAWTIDNSSTQAARTQIAACKYTCAKVLARCRTGRSTSSARSASPTSRRFQAMWAGAPTMSVMDGVDEVHKVTVARNVLKGYRPHDGLWPTEYSRTSGPRPARSSSRSWRPTPTWPATPTAWTRVHCRPRAEGGAWSSAGRVAVVTGGGGGIGEALCRAFAAEGAGGRRGRHRRRRGRTRGRVARRLRP
jgi:alkylation response protein AidB-like acyl-CoA dehydrogenase